MSPNASYRTTARCRSASAALVAERRHLLPQPVHVLREGVDAGAAATSAVRRTATSETASADDGGDQGKEIHASETRSASEDTWPDPPSRSIRTEVDAQRCRRRSQ